jgi:phosphomannomutase
MSLMIGVSGIRGLVGSTLTPQFAASAGAAFGTHLAGGKVVVGRDSRPSGDMVRAAVVSGLLACGCDVVDVGIAATPSIAIMVGHASARGGIVITASHNPPPWNGIKFLTAEGCAPPASVAQRIIDTLHGGRFAYKPVEALGALSCDDRVHDLHVEKVLKLVDVAAIRRRKFRCVLDSVNGAGGPAGRKLLDELGCTVVHLNPEPHGRFAHMPEPTRENLTDLAARTAAEKADVGFAQDPDADRMAIVDEHGVYFGEEYTLALAAKFMFGRHPGAAVANLSTSRMIDDLAAAAGGACKVFRSAVGEANVVEVMNREKAVLGGEGNGGVIDPRVVLVRDSLTSMAFTLQVLVDAGKPLSQVIASMPRYTMVKQKFECARERIEAALAAIRKTFASERLNTIDGVRIDWPEGWVHVRASNTEPIMRVLGEANSEATANGLIGRVQKVIDEAL